MISKDTLTNRYENFFSKLNFADGLAPLIIRLIIAPVMIVAGYNKLGLSSADATFAQSLLADPNIVNWFGNTQWGLGLPFPDLLAFLAGWGEFLGGWFILFGLLTRFWAIPLMITMVVAATTVHWDNGWHAIAPTNGSTASTLFFDWFGFAQADKAMNDSIEAGKRLDEVKGLIEQSEYTPWIKAKGPVVILNNGIEFSVIYFVMLLSLFFTGGGRFTSLDYWAKQSVFK